MDHEVQHARRSLDELVRLVKRFMKSIGWKSGDGIRNLAGTLVSSVGYWYDKIHVESVLTKIHTLCHARALRPLYLLSRQKKGGDVCLARYNIYKQPLERSK